ncbi:MAG: homoserine dehydrogenase [Candidatus Omnitrophica bacterium]|nr:homoserine dehydrogenase [Candidatus Omnitrophota bacterium]
MINPLDAIEDKAFGKLQIGLIGYGTVGQGVLKILRSNRTAFQKRYNAEFNIRTICDRSIDKKRINGLRSVKRTKKYQDVINDPAIDIVIELIGGKHPAKEIVEQALRNGKDVITANKDLIANHGLELFKIAQQHGRHLYYESAVGAGIPMIKTVSETIAGNSYRGIYGIINGTCNFILDEMSKKLCSFDDALAEAQKRGYAEADPTLDVNGMDSTHKLAILTFLAFQRMLPVKSIYTEGITDISHIDIAYAESLDLCIKLLAIAKESKGGLEARVHPTLISKDHPLAAVHGVYNAIYLDADPLGKVMLTGEGAGQMAAASGVIADLINAANAPNNPMYSNHFTQNQALRPRRIDHIETKFYIRIHAVDEPGVLSQVTGILGRAGIGINSVSQQQHDGALKAVPVIMLTDYTTEKVVRTALKKIQKLDTVRHKPVAIRMEKL